MESLRNKAYRLLRRSEKIFKTDMVYLAKGGFWLTSAQAIASISTFLLAIAFANLLPRENYGTYKYIMAVAGTLTVFSLTGMGTAVTRSVAKGFEGVLMPAFKTRLSWGLIGSIVSVGAATYYYINGNLTLAGGLLIIGIFSPFMEAFGLYDSVWHGRKRFDVSTKYFSIGQISSIVLAIIILFFTDNPLILVLAYFVSWTAFRYIFFKRTLSQISNDNSSTDSTISYGKHLSLMSIVAIIANYADRILIFHYVGAIEAAIYSIAIAMPEQLKGVFKNIGNLALPKFSERPQEELRISIWDKIAKMAGILLVATMLYVVSAPYIFKLFFPQYLDAIIYSQVFSISLLAIVSTIPLSFLEAHEKKKILYITNISSPLLQLFLMFPGAYYYGILGVILAKASARIINTLILLVLFKNSMETQNSNEH